MASQSAFGGRDVRTVSLYCCILQQFLLIYHAVFVSVVWWWISCRWCFSCSANWGWRRLGLKCLCLPLNANYFLVSQFSSIINSAQLNPFYSKRLNADKDQIFFFVPIIWFMVVSIILVCVLLSPVVSKFALNLITQSKKGIQNSCQFGSIPVPCLAQVPRYFSLP